MGTNALDNTIVVIGQDDVTLRIELEDKVVGKVLASEADDNNSFDSYLPH